MSARSLNKVQLIGNLTRDPELRYTPQGTAVCTFGLATNRTWITESSEKKEDTEFHRIVAWNKLAELCSQLIFKGRKVFVEGRLQTREWTGKDGGSRQVTEVVISDMIILDNKRAAEDRGGVVASSESFSPKAASVKEMPPADGTKAGDKAEPKAEKAGDKTAKKEEKESEEVKPEDIPF